MSDSAEALPDAQSPAELLEVILDVGQRLAGMNAEWWRREHFRPSPDSGGAFVVIDPRAEAAWHRRQTATEYRDALRLQALRICAANPSLPAPPPATHDAEADINERLAQWCLDQRGHQSATRAGEEDAAGGTASLAKSWLNVDNAGEPYWPTVAALLADLKSSLPTYLRAARRRQRLTFDQAREFRRLLAGLDQVESKRRCISTEDQRTYEDGAKRLQSAFAELVSMEGLDVAALRRELRQRFSPAWCAYLDLSAPGLDEETYVRVHRDAHFYTAKVRAKQRLTPKEVDRLWAVTFSHLVFQARPPEVAEGDRRPTIEQETEPAYRRLWRVTPVLASRFGLDSAGYLADFERRGFWFRFHQTAEDAMKNEDKPTPGKDARPNTTTPRIRAGEAFAAKIESDPKAKAAFELVRRRMQAFGEAVRHIATARDSAIKAASQQIGEAMADVSALQRFDKLDELATKYPDLAPSIRELEDACQQAKQAEEKRRQEMQHRFAHVTDDMGDLLNPRTPMFDDPTFWDDIQPIGEQIKEAFREALAEHEQQKAKALPHGDGDPKAPYMPVDWFKDEFGLTAESLRGQARRGNLATTKRGHWNQYSVPDAMAIWPQLVTYGPNEGK